MQDSGETRCHTHMLWISAEFEERRRGRLEKCVISLFLMAADKTVQEVRKRKDDVEILDRERRHHLLLCPTGVVRALANRAVPIPA